MCPCLRGAAQILVLGAALVIGPTVAGAEPIVTGARIGAYPSKTRFVLEASERLRFEVFTLADPYRIVVDLPEVAWKLSTKRRPVGGLITDFRFGLFRAGISRVVLDVDGPVTVAKSFALTARNGKPYRIVVDLKKVSRKEFLKAQRPRSVAGPPPRGLPPAAVDRSKRTGKMLIAIDPGHGGVDPGTIGANNTQEKRITLAFAKKLRARLKKTGRYLVVMTRTRDVFVRLRERIALARSAGADLFISLHADSILNKRVRGGAIYTLSERASDSEAAALAAKENKADVIGGMDLNDHSPEVAHILIDLAQRETMNDSVVFAEALVTELQGAMRLLRRNRRFAGFAVLKSPDVPSVLVELGYLSNRHDERMLKDKRHTDKVASAIVRAVDAYFARMQAFKRP